MLEESLPAESGEHENAGTRTDGPVPVDVVLGLGSNLGDPPAQLRRAIAELSADVDVLAVSDLYMTEPVGIRRQPEFGNIVLTGRTRLPVLELLERTQSIERKLGRTTGERYGPRLIDIDLLAYGELVISSERLIVPHPWLHRRTFVLVPLAAVAPDWRHPVFGATAEQMLLDLRMRTDVRRVGPLDPVATPT